MSDYEVVVIGAGPFGLSISAHLRGLGVDHLTVGKAMDTWKAHCPPGMKLRSEPYGSDMASPQPGYDVKAFCQLRGIDDYVDRLGPLSVERFLEYADWYTEQLVPDVTDYTVTDVSAAAGGFRVSFADAEPVTARKVVVATGVVPYRVLPAELSGLSDDLISHSIDHHLLSRFAGRKVAVVGGGQSAMETAALLNEAGATVQVVARRPAISWLEPNPETISSLGRVRRPVNKLCEGWHCAFWNSPAAFRMLPEQMRIDKARTVLGPAGAWWLKDRIVGVVEVMTSHQLRGAVAHGSGVRLLVDGPVRSEVDADHVIAATGFKIDIARLPFLPAGLRAGIDQVNHYPAVNRAGETSVPGLYFAGATASVSLGPSVRFIAGTHNSARQMARSLASPAKGTGPAATAGAKDQVKAS
jgi:thioredoxin reductase